ncbi:MAG: cohesin domain-containing protein [Candidatus Bathyarchaeia archaeon]
MRKRRSLPSLTLILLALGIIFFKIPFVVNTPLSIATLYINPSPSVGMTGENFSINISISEVTDLYGWEFKLGWNNTMLDAVNIIEGSFLKNGGNTFFTYKINNTAGYALVDCTLLGNIGGVNGSGTLATIEFYVKEAGECAFDLYDTILVSSSERFIEHSAVDGYCYTVSEPFHDIAIVDLKKSKNIVGEGFTVFINVTVSNRGTFQETFNISIYYDGFPITLPDGKDYVTLSLSAKNTLTLTLAWNTTQVPKGNYTISTYATSVPNETDTANNSFTDGYLIVAMVGDIFGIQGFPDGKVDMRDVAAVAKLFGVNYPNPMYNPDRDIIYDGKIDMKDVALVAKHFGKIDP